MNAQQTPTPWTTLELPGRSDRIVRDDENYSMVCEFPYGLTADAAFIVRACNSHEALVAALKEIARTDRTIKTSAADLADIARAAIVQAGEGA